MVEWSPLVDGRNAFVPTHKSASSSSDDWKRVDFMFLSEAAQPQPRLQGLCTLLAVAMQQVDPRFDLSCFLVVLRVPKPQ